MFLVDSHCHLDMLDLEKTTTGLEAGLDGVLEVARKRGVGHFLAISVNPWKLDSLRELIAPYKDVSLSVGLHPLHQPDRPITLEELTELASADDLVALGETGLDYHYDQDNHQLQQDYFQMHLDAALAVNKPVIVHTREAKEDTYRLLKAYAEQGGQGVIHCFTEDLEFARQMVGLGFYISLSGIVTFNSAKQLRQVAEVLPLDRLLVETDSPYLAPVPHRGKQNEPGYVRDVAEFIAELRGLDSEFLAHQTTENFFRLFPLARKQTSGLVSNSKEDYLVD
ncbi:TatD DNase family protein [Marinospirillum celere]|uniref:TatD DNase family protein n=1 Tax=Marinospirillum celere TaxID=1122252 RepID=A0A1I1F266_9GAMM|nr:TatD family hydrolase [Marinospirillum celere]SFB91243.1 TatD DNase family protein [Marinospirillum celere]